MPGAEQRPGQVRPIGRPNFQQFEPGAAPGAGSADALRSGEQFGKPEIHYGGTPIVTVRVVNGVQQDIPHLHIDSRGGQTRWWIEREPIESWQERVRAAQESGDKRYEGISPDRLPSSICHTYPNIPSTILERQPAYRDREWVTLSYSLTPTQEQGRVALARNQEGEVTAETYTFLNTAAIAEDEITSFRRSARLIVAPSEILDETLPAVQAEAKPKPIDEEEQ